jgi:hypothetical protein
LEKAKYLHHHKIIKVVRKYLPENTKDGEVEGKMHDEIRKRRPCNHEISVYMHVYILKG